METSTWVETETWAEAMLEVGIYIPEQDASWERPGVAGASGFEDVDQEPLRVCHAKLCFCSHEAGRSHHSEHGLWEILKCDSCGYKVSSASTAVSKWISFFHFGVQMADVLNELLMICPSLEIEIKSFVFNPLSR